MTRQREVDDEALQTSPNIEQNSIEGDDVPGKKMLQLEDEGIERRSRRDHRKC